VLPEEKVQVPNSKTLVFAISAELWRDVMSHVLRVNNIHMSL
jgi:hypothetical protein